jgi:hypothetical protein
MKKVLFVLTILLVFQTSFSDDLRVRAMTKNTIHYATPDGRISTADYWQLALGNFEIRVHRRYPGEGMVQIDGSANVAFMSGGYLEGNGFGTRGRLTTTAEFAVKRGDKFEIVRPDAIDYIFFGGTRVKLRDADEEEDLFVFIEDPYNTCQAKMFSLRIFSLSRNTGELDYEGIVESMTAVSFSADGARRGHQATIAEASR